jgi:dolichol-phosphate mannosyltransferase
VSAALPLVLVVPVYHEQETIGRTLDELASKVPIPHRTLVVYDKDDDPTVPVVKALLPRLPHVELVKNDIKRGVLGAIRKGFQVAMEVPGDAAVCVVMADLSDELSGIEKMYRALQEGADLVAGSRYCPGGAQHGGPLLKRTLSRLAGRSLHAVTSMPTHDVTNAFRMYRASFLRRIEIESEGGFELSLELTVKAWAYGFRIAEVPSVWRDRTAGESKFKLAAWLPKYLRWYVGALGWQYLGRRPGSGPSATSSPPAP